MGKVKNTLKAAVAPHGAGLYKITVLWIIIMWKFKEDNTSAVITAVKAYSKQS